MLSQRYIDDILNANRTTENEMTENETTENKS